MPPIRLGVIGAGLIWERVHRPILAELGAAFVPVAICDSSPERRAAAAAAYPGAAILADHRALLELPAVEVALVLTPIALNAPLAADALRAGKHVIMEKPIARSVAEGHALVELARSRGRTLCVAEQIGYRRAEATIADTIGAGAIGDLVGWSWVHHLEADRAAGAMRFETTDWRRRADFPLGTMFDGGVHLIAGLSRIFGAPLAVSATGQKLRPEYGDYDHVAALFRYRGGAGGALSYSSYLPPLANHRHIHGSAGSIVFEGDRLRVLRPGRPEETVALPDEDAYRSMWDAFVGVFQRGAAPAYSPAMALRDVAILEALARAIASGGAVELAESQRG